MEFMGRLGGRREEVDNRIEDRISRADVEEKLGVDGGSLCSRSMLVIIAQLKLTQSILGSNSMHPKSWGQLHVPEHRYKFGSHAR